VLKRDIRPGAVRPFSRPYSRAWHSIVHSLSIEVPTVPPSEHRGLDLCPPTPPASTLSIAALSNRCLRHLVTVAGQHRFFYKAPFLRDSPDPSSFFHLNTSLFVLPPSNYTLSRSRPTSPSNSNQLIFFELKQANFIIYHNGAAI
jgi:hypothetical protein